MSNQKTPEHGMPAPTEPAIEKTPSQTFMAGGFGTRRDAAIYLGISEPSVSRLVRRGDLKAYRVAGRRLVRVKRTDCDEFMAARPAFTAWKATGVRHGR